MAAMNAEPASRSRVILCVVCGALLVMGLGGWATQLGPWYYALQQPPWRPPDWLFGPAWTLIYLCAGTAAVLAWEAEPTAAGRRWQLALWALNGALNVGWSVLFFTLQRPDWALMEVGPLWLSILALCLVLRRSSGRAAALLLPYLAWVAFAATLNASIVRLNPALGA